MRMADSVMKLTIAEYPIDEIVFGESTALADRRLVVSSADLEAIAAEEDAIASVEAAVARPGETTRIIHVLDAVEAMVKIDGPGTVFPGFLGPAVTVGHGTTNKLTGMLVVSTTEFPEPMPGGLAFREGIIDMFGPGQAYCQASQTINLVLHFRPRAGVSNRQLDDAIRLTTLRIAQFLGAASRGLVAARREVFELGAVAPDLPRVAYVDQIMSQALNAVPPQSTVVEGWGMK